MYGVGIEKISGFREDFRRHLEQRRHRVLDRRREYRIGINVF